MKALGAKIKEHHACHEDLCGESCGGALETVAPPILQDAFGAVLPVSAAYAYGSFSGGLSRHLVDFLQTDCHSLAKEVRKPQRHVGHDEDMSTKNVSVLVAFANKLGERIEDWVDYWKCQLCKVACAEHPPETQAKFLLVDRIDGKRSQFSLAWLCFLAGGFVAIGGVSALVHTRGWCRYARFGEESSLCVESALE